MAVGYNAQVAVDAKHNLIVEQQVTNQVLDLGLLTSTAEPAKQVLGVDTIAVVADRGYFKIEDIEACENAGMDPYVPRPQRGPSVTAGLFRKDEFQYDADSDSFICPARQRLNPYSSSLLRGLNKINYTNKLACDDCAIRSRCTAGRFRTVSRLENEAVLDRMQARLAKRPDVLSRRREMVEHPFGSIKQWMNQGAFLMRGLEKVRAEFSLTALAYNLRRVFNLVGFTELMAAVTAWRHMAAGSRQAARAIAQRHDVDAAFSDGTGRKRGLAPRGARPNANLASVTVQPRFHTVCKTFGTKP